MDGLKPEQVMEMLKKKGVEVNIEQATAILQFLQLLASIVIGEYLKKH